MITEIIKSFNGFIESFKGYTKENLTPEAIQKIYDALTVSAVVVCTCHNPACGNHCSFICWGYYYRTLIVFNITVRLKVRRLRCKTCGHTQAVHFLPMIGYCQVSLESMLDILLNPNINDIDGVFEESYIYRKRKQYKDTWDSRMIALGIKKITIPINDLSSAVLNAYHRQFMQVHRGNNYLMYLPT